MHRITILVVLAGLLPSVARAQVAAYAAIPSWTNAQVQLVDAHTGALVGSMIKPGEPYDVAITPDGRRAFVTFRASHSVAAIDLVTWQIIAMIPVGAGAVPRGVAITRDGTRAWVTQAGANSVAVIDTALTAVVGPPIPVGQMPWGIAIRPKGDRAYVVNRANSTVSVIDIDTRRVIAVLPVDREPVEIAIAPDGLTAYVTSTIDNTVVPIDLTTHTVRPSIPVGLFPRDLAITPDGKQIFVANSNSGTVSIIETAAQAVTSTISMGPGSIPSGVTITPDGTRVLVGTQTGMVRMLDAATHAVGTTLFFGGQVLRLSTSPNIIVGSPALPLMVADDADLERLGFRDYIPFKDGTLQATHSWSTTRHVSLVTTGTIDTQGFDVEILGNVLKDGALSKRGSGTLTLGGANTHPTTDVHEGTLAVTGRHPGLIRIGPAATLSGTGRVSRVEAMGGTISPGLNGSGVLQTSQVLMGPADALVIEINGIAAGTQYDQLVSGTTSLGGATLVLHVGGPMPQGATFTIVTKATGTFAGLPEGTVVTTVFGTFRITYRGGPTLSDVVLIAQ